MTRETLLKVEQSLLVLLNSHGCSSSGRVARNAFRIILFDGIGRDTRGMHLDPDRELAPTELRGDVFQDAFDHVSVVVHAERVRYGHK